MAGCRFLLQKDKIDPLCVVILRSQGWSFSHEQRLFLMRSCDMDKVKVSDSRKGFSISSVEIQWSTDPSVSSILSLPIWFSTKGTRNSFGHETSLFTCYEDERRKRRTATEGLMWDIVWLSIFVVLCQKVQITTEDPPNRIIEASFRAKKKTTKLVWRSLKLLRLHVVRYILDIMSFDRLGSTTPIQRWKLRVVWSLSKPGVLPWPCRWRSCTRMQWKTGVFCSKYW